MSVRAHWSRMLSGAATLLDALWGDFFFALRRLSATPTFVSIVVITFAVGIGANAAVFNVTSAIILRPLPFPNGPRLVQILTTDPQGHTEPAVSLANAHILREQTHVLRAVAIANGSHHLTANVNGHSYAVSGLFITADFVRTLGIAPETRAAPAMADRKLFPHSVIVSYEFSHKVFGDNASAIGSSIGIDKRRYAIVGILPRGQPLVDPESASLGMRDVLLPFPPGVLSDSGPYQSMLGAVGLLDPNTTIAQANAAIAGFAHGVSLRSLHEASVGPVESTLFLVVIAVIAITLLACANVTNMLAARWSYREQEFAVRRALGATGSRIAYQLLIETMVLAFAGGVTGIACAYLLLRMLGGRLTAILPPNSSLTIDAPTLLYGLVLVAACGLFSATFPILAQRNHDVRAALSNGGRRGGIGQRSRFGPSLIVTEIALALALVTSACLIVKGFVNLMATPLGVRTAGVVLTDPVDVRGYRTMAAQETLRKRLLSALRSLPGARSAALSITYPQSGFHYISHAATYRLPFAGARQPATDWNAPLAAWNAVTTGYFSTLGIPVLTGRSFEDSDTAGSDPVAIVDTEFVEHFLKGKNPLGVLVSIDSGSPNVQWARVVGVVGNERVSNVVADGPTKYTPMSQTSAVLDGVMFAEVYAPALAPTTAGSEMHQAFATALPQSPTPDTFTFSERVATDATDTKSLSILVSMLALIALTLAASGIFGVVAFAVSRRIREFGVRMALGATTKMILFDVLRRAMGTALVGSAIGLIISVVASGLLQRNLQNVSALDLRTAALMVLLVCVSAFFAALLPMLLGSYFQPIPGANACAM